jgi:hypothetical protein
MPDHVAGCNVFPVGWPEINWLAELSPRTYFSLWTQVDAQPILPVGYPLYVVTFHQERFDPDWLLSQAALIDAPIIVLNDGSVYDFPFPPNVHFFQYYSWHYHMQKIMEWFPDRQARNVKYKISNVCNRITQSKLLIFTALMEYHDRDQLMVVLGDWLEEKNVHFRQPTEIAELDRLADIFYQKYYGTQIRIDKFDNATDNNQRTNSNPWQPLYLESALHFSSESYHYSRMNINRQSIVRPGPQFSEKTYKCLIAGTPFIPVGQFESYKYFRELGLQFDYGDIDLSWDNDPGNLTRLVSLIQLIKSLTRFSTGDIQHMTQQSTQHNFDHIWSGQFNRRCLEHNQQVAAQVIAQFG